MPAQSPPETQVLSKEDVQHLRAKLLCPALTTSYSNTGPLMIMKGKGVYLYDEHGQSYLDTRNNVAHVGHAHPTVAAAIADQAAELSTNTRYLHPNLVLLAEKLLAKCPPPLKRVIFVNSGSEANDLALRLAWAHTRNQDIVVLDRAYHGHTATTINVSPYKAEGKGGSGLPKWVHKVSCPDTYRGPHRGPDAAQKYADEVKSVCDRVGQVAAFIMESGLSVGGVILPPAGYLPAVYKAVRAAGGICIADEVQTGFGRFGTHFWAFEEQGVVPDIITLGKPIGNGMPLAAVVTTEEISTSFHNGMEYFNTFGGNTLSCAAGLAVLDVLEKEGLQAHALEVGTYLKSRLQALSQGQSLIGQVRGQGLFIGIEFVQDRKSLAPATTETSVICSRLKEIHRILTSIDGPHANVLVLKPPLCFSFTDANRFVTALSDVLDMLTPADIAIAQHTPT
eukprot:GGOE01018660.1.p1 GENE.GGOE01018660.1~~GGOE01018660.1.p1  ORF type:complete len:451 (-),score=108.98 GGOE01018660.1:48-1400(-)